MVVLFEGFGGEVGGDAFLTEAADDEAGGFSGAS